MRQRSVFGPGAPAVIAALDRPRARRLADPRDDTARRYRRRHWLFATTLWIVIIAGLVLLAAAIGGTLATAVETVRRALP